MGAALRFKHVSVPRQQGEQARLKVVQGPDFGAVYVVTDARATLGRGEENDLVVSDLKASRRHAELQRTPSGWVVRDLGSANGLLHNGKATREASLKTGDALTFGETTFEFVAGEAATMMIVAPPRDARELQASRAAFEDQRQRVRAFGVIQGGKGAQAAGSRPSADSGKSRRLLVYAAAGVAAFYFLTGDPAPRKKGKAPKSDATEDLRKYLPGGAPDPGTAKTVEQFFRAGFREYMAGNYLRARSQFETVLQMSPGHSLAKLYLENCDRDIKAEIDFHLKQGKRNLDSGKLKMAKGHYEAILRILFRDQSDAAFVEARDQLEKVNKLMAGGEGAS